MTMHVYTKRIVCRACRCVFTMTSPASKFCKNRECINARRRADRKGSKT